MRPRTLSISVLLGWAGLAVPAIAEPWHLQGWQARAVVEIAKPSTAAGCDTAGVKVLCQGRAKADGSDYRVLDAAGKPVPFLLAFHDAARYSLLSFRAADPKGRYFVYFNNPQATRAAEQIVVDEKPGAGPPKGDWLPKFGLVYETRARPRATTLAQETNPKTVEEMAKLIAASPRKFGARYQRGISDGYNPFGPSDYYVSVYRGWLHVPKAGKYRFCTVSNEASFSFIDGKELVHWPGRHTTERGIRGEINATVELTAGPHYVEYYHEEVVLDQMAFLGWRPSPDEGPFAPIPEEIWPAPHDARAAAYESPKGPMPHFEPVITDSIWPVEHSTGQYTRAKFAAGKGLSDGTSYRWDFGDGQSAVGPEAAHVYLNMEKTYAVTLTAQGPAGAQTATWPLEVFEIEHVTDQFKEGKPKDYAKLAKGYDRSKLDAAALAELAHLFAEAEEPAEAMQVGREYVQRFPTADALPQARVRRLIADCALQLGRGGVDEALANYRAALVKEMPATEKLQVLARLIRLLGVERSEADKAVAVLTEVEEVVKSSRLDDDGRKAYRQAVIAAGDAELWRNRADEALKLYRRAEVLRGEPIPTQVRAARIGAYPNSLREYIQGGNYGAALDLVNSWDDTFPTDKPNGQTFYWRGKLLTLRNQPREAARYLARAVEVTVGAPFETEARWLLAEALEQTGRAADARKELAKLVATGLADEYTKRAREKLKKN